MGANLLGAHVTILGGGGITESLLRMLGPFGCHITVVRRNVPATWTAPTTWSRPTATPTRSPAPTSSCSRWR